MISRLFVISEKTERGVFFFLAAAVAVSISFKAIYNSISCITLFAFWLIFMGKRFERKNIWQILLISSPFWIALIGLANTNNMDEGLWSLQQKALLLLLPLVFGTITFNWSLEYSKLISIFIAGVFISCLVCVGGAFFLTVKTRSTEWFFGHGLASFIDIYPYIFSLLCLSSILILIEAYIGNVKLYKLIERKSISATLIIFFSIFVFLLSVKQIILAWAFFGTLYSFRINKNWSKTLLSVATGLALLTIFVMTIPTLRTKAREIFSSEENTIPLDQDASLGRTWNGIAMRKAVWTCAWDVVRDNYLVGVGTGDAQDELQKAYENRKFYFASRYNRYNAHNEYLQVLINFGSLGLLIWLSSYVLLIRSSITNHLFIFLFGIFSFAMLTESILEVNKGILTIAYVLTVLLFGQEQMTEKK